MNVRNIEPEEKCKFCAKKHVSWVTVFSNASKYTHVYKIPYCEDHKDSAEEAKKDAESPARAYKANLWD